MKLYLYDMKEGGNVQVNLTSKSKENVLRYLLQANDETCPLKPWERRQLLYVRAPDEYMGY